MHTPKLKPPMKKIIIIPLFALRSIQKASKYLDDLDMFVFWFLELIISPFCTLQLLTFELPLKPP